MNLASVIILLVVLSCVVLALVSLRRGAGTCKCGQKDCSCGSACSGCAMKDACHR